MSYQRLSLCIVILVILLPTNIYSQEWFKHYVASRTALNEKNYAEYLRHTQVLDTLLPNHPEILYQLAGAFARVNDTAKAFAVLERLITMKAPFTPETDANEGADFAGLAGNTRFMAIVKKFMTLNTIKRHADTAFRIPDNKLIPEGIAYDPQEHAFYLGSIAKRKILKITADGKVSDFTTPPLDSLWNILGMTVDAKRHHLWVCAPAGPRDGKLNRSSAIYQYDLRTRKQLKRFIMPNTNGKHLFNDIVINNAGDAFFTDSEAGAVYSIRYRVDSITTVIAPGTMDYPNGITLSPDQNTLFIADFRGIWRFSLKSQSNKPLAALTTSTVTPLHGIDGLYFYHADGKPSLVAVQNGMGKGRVMRFFLNSTMTNVHKAEIKEVNHPAFLIPTTGAIADRHIYVIANSQLRAYTETNNTYNNPEKLQDIIILRVPLK